MYNNLESFSEVIKMEKCNLCPRKCGVDREASMGFCKMSKEIHISRVGLHEWEEPCISYGKGSGTIFFTGCNMRCVYCQNNEISTRLKGTKASVDTLSYEMLHLQEIGAVNINLVTPTHYADKILLALERIKHKLNIPVIYNTSGYECVETLKTLDGYIDIYLPDVKYYSEKLSKKYSNCKDYFDVTIRAVGEMIRQTGKCVIDKDGHMKSGTLLRHLVLPSHYKDSIDLFSNLVKFIDPKMTAVSVMCQYFPTHMAKDYPEINRKITTLEYMKVVNFVNTLGFDTGFMQEKSSAKSEYVPIFNY